MIEQHIHEALAGNAQRLALDFVAYLRNQEMQFERGTGYWEDKRYWHVKYKETYVCFILINGFGAVRHKDEPEGWIIWSDDYDSNLFANHPLDERTKEIALDHVDICGNCGGCGSQGKNKSIFGREFEKVCVTMFRFDNPNVDEVECAKKLVELKKSDIDAREGSATKENNL